MTVKYPSLQFSELQSVLFLGIGGIGMSAIARYFHSRGIHVTGYDRTPSPLTYELSDAGMTISYMDDLDLTKTAYDVVIYTPAIPTDSILLQHYQQSDTPLIKRAQALGIITQDKKTIAVAGSHGKTTVSSMIAFVLRECGIDASAFLGGISTNFNSNYVYGNSEYVVVEADEFDKSFLQLQPDYIVLTSIDTDHLDIYGDRSHIVASFQEFISLLPASGELILSENVSDQVRCDGHTRMYGVDRGDWHTSHIEVKPGSSKFRMTESDTLFTLHHNGRHNIENAIAAISIGRILGISYEQLAIALAKFTGIKRRFELIYQDEKTTFIDDYAHHPTEIEALLNSVREIYPDQQILSIFQPHLFSRTKDLAVDFAKALDLSDQTILLPIYPAREKPMSGVTSEIISSKMNSPSAVVEKQDLIEAIKARPCTIILSIGAGDISELVPRIKQIWNAS